MDKELSTTMSKVERERVCVEVCNMLRFRASKIRSEWYVRKNCRNIKKNK